MPDLQELLNWLDSHINYERRGPAGSAERSSSEVHDPERRLRHLRSYMELMDDPHRAFPSIHITGTNGKSSTAWITSALLGAQGLSTGTYTSPHLERVNERIVTNGDAIPDDDLAEVLEAVCLLEPLAPERLSYFELLTAAAFRYFADRPVEAGVIEVGVGGRWDATNVVDGAVAVVTNVGLDHMNYLGPTRRDIATQKAGIIKPGSSVVLSETDPELVRIFEAQRHGQTFRVGSEYGVSRNVVAVGGRVLDLYTPTAKYEDVFLSLHGAHQGSNAATALMATEAFFEAPLPDDVVREAMGTATSPGRMEILNRQPLCLVDGAHNAAGVRALVASIKEEFGDASQRVLVVGMLSPHDPKEILHALEADRARLVIACEPDWPRAVPASEIAEAARSLGATAVVVPDVGQAVNEGLAAAGQEDLVLVTGSLYVVGAARKALGRPGYPEA